MFNVLCFDSVYVCVFTSLYACLCGAITSALFLSLSLKSLLFGLAGLESVPRNQKDNKYSRQPLSLTPLYYVHGGFQFELEKLTWKNDDWRILKRAKFVYKYREYNKRKWQRQILKQFLR